MVQKKSQKPKKKKISKSEQATLDKIKNLISNYRKKIGK